MSSGPVETYNGTSGVADSGGDSLTEDLNIYYSVRETYRLCHFAGRQMLTILFFHRQATLPGL